MQPTTYSRVSVLYAFFGTSNDMIALLDMQQTRENKLIFLLLPS
jgi:hypothetical protein